MKYKSNTTPCIVTGLSPVDLHHVKTRASGGTDDQWNLMPLIRKLHQELHQSGLSRFSQKYGPVEYWLISYGWEYDQIRSRWSHS